MAHFRQIKVLNLYVLFVVSLIVLKQTFADHVSESDLLQLLNRVNSKVDGLESKLEVLDNKLDILLEADNADKETDESEAEVPSSALDLPVSLLSAQRISLPTIMNQFIICLKNNSDGELLFRFNGDGDEREPDQVVALEDGVISVRVNSYSRSESEVLFFQVMDSKNDHVTTIYLKNGNGLESAYQDLQNISIPTLDVSPEIEAVYEPGNNISLQVVLVPDDPTVEDLPSIGASFTGVDLTSMEETHYYGSNNPVVYTSQYYKSPDTVDATITVATAQTPISGYLYVYSDVNSRGTSVVRGVQVMRALVIRPSNQEGPFPHGFLTIVNSHNIFRSSENGHELIDCNVGEECLFHCYALGETVSSVTVSRILPDGSSAPVPSQRNPPQYLSSMQSVHWKFQSRDDSGNSEGITTFRCLAIDARTMSVASKYIDVQALLPGFVDGDRSSMTIEEDPEDPALRRISINCGIGGRPLPDVFFLHGTVDFLLHMPDGPDTVINTGPNEGVAQKNYTMSVDELRESGNFNCQLFSLSVGNVTSHHFTVPVDDL